MSDNKVLGTIAVRNDGKVATASQIKGWINVSKIQADRDVQPIWNWTVDFVMVSPNEDFPLADS